MLDRQQRQGGQQQRGSNPPAGALRHGSRAERRTLAALRRAWPQAVGGVRGGRRACQRKSRRALSAGACSCGLGRGQGKTCKLGMPIEGLASRVCVMARATLASVCSARSRPAARQPACDEGQERAKRASAGCRSALALPPRVAGPDPPHHGTAWPLINPLCAILGAPSVDVTLGKHEGCRWGRQVGAGERQRSGGRPPGGSKRACGPAKERTTERWARGAE